MVKKLFGEDDSGMDGQRDSFSLGSLGYTQLRIKLFIACVKCLIAVYKWMVYGGCM